MTQLAAGSISFVGQDVVAYVSGFYVVFYNFVRRQTVGQVQLGPNLDRVRQLEFYQNNSKFLTCEERPEGACVSVYARNSATNYEFTLQFRILLTVQLGSEPTQLRSVLCAKFIGLNKIAVISGAPEFMFLVYENDQKTAAIPTFTLKVAEPKVVETDLEKTKILQLNDKELLIVCGQTLKCVRIQ